MVRYRLQSLSAPACKGEKLRQKLPTQSKKGKRESRAEETHKIRKEVAPKLGNSVASRSGAARGREGVRTSCPPGHLLGLSHDDSKFCEENFGSTEDKRLMSSILTSIDAFKPWSKCTSVTITEFLDDGHGNCLLDIPRKQIQGPEELPGQTYDATQQCNLTFGPEYSVCPGMDICARLWCAVVRQGQMVCLTKKLLAVEGTPCGKGRICLQGKCVDKTKKKYYSTSSHGNWGSWRPWGQLSRSCGGVVEFAYRHCNNPAPRNSGRYCTGKRAIYRSCSVMPCPPNGKSFRHEQCEAKKGYQSDAKGVKTFVEWVPKYAGVLPADMCKLTCRAKGTGYYVVFSPKVTNYTLAV
ncbi:A disintegrin and metalloproteinase with thrombospondin motifs 5 [Callospermophilus lateralis]|uniref:A disintegrin and metalloproteinase with thrombospondin motifs 5 n=1 Tax=Callospermophilus lateralis TaxID=76772 RepID=UPI00405473DE